MSNQPSATRAAAEIGTEALGTSTIVVIFASFYNSVSELEILGRLKDVIFPVAAFASLAKLCNATYDLFFDRSSHNKTSSKWVNFALKLAGAVLTTLAVLGSILAAAAYVILAPVLFLVGICLDFLYCSTLLAWNAFKYFSLKKPEEDPDPGLHEMAQKGYKEEKQQYKDNMWKYAKGALVTAVCGVAVGLLMLSKIGLIAVGIAMIKTTAAGCVGAGAALITGGIGAKGIVGALRALMKSKAAASPEVTPEPSTSDKKSLSTVNPNTSRVKIAVSLEAATERTNSWKTPTSMFERNYSPYFTKNRQAFVERIVTADDKKAYLVRQIELKIEKLLSEIRDDHSYFQFQREKRENKIHALECLRETLETTSETNDSVAAIEKKDATQTELKTTLEDFKQKYKIVKGETINTVYEKVRQSGAFQSFKFLKGDVEDIFDGALESSRTPWLSQASLTRFPA